MAKRAGRSRPPELLLRSTFGKRFRGPKNGVHLKVVDARPRQARVKLLILCTGEEGEEGEVTLWQMQVRQVRLTPRQRRQLNQRMKAGPTCVGAVRARVLDKDGPELPPSLRRLLIQKGLAQVKQVTCERT